MTAGTPVNVTIKAVGGEVAEAVRSVNRAGFELRRRDQPDIVAQGVFNLDWTQDNEDWVCFLKNVFRPADKSDERHGQVVSDGYYDIVAVLYNNADEIKRVNSLEVWIGALRQ